MAEDFLTKNQTSSELELLRDALLTADVKKIKILLKNGIDPSIYNNFGIICFPFLNCKAIRHSSEKGHFEVVKLLLNHPKVDPSANKNIGMNFIDIIKYL